MIEYTGHRYAVKQRLAGRIVAGHLQKLASFRYFVCACPLRSGTMARGGAIGSDRDFPRGLVRDAARRMGLQPKRACRRQDQPCGWLMERSQFRKSTPQAVRLDIIPRRVRTSELVAC